MRLPIQMLADHAMRREIEIVLRSETGQVTVDQH